MWTTQVASLLEAGCLLSGEQKGEVLCTTAYVGGAPAPQREFGTGFGRTRCAAASVSLEHTVAVMPGIAPVVLIEAVVQNYGATRQIVEYREAWGTGMIHQLSGHGWGGWSSSNSMPSMLDRRQFVQSHFNSSFRRFNAALEHSGGTASGVEQTRSFLGLTQDESDYFHSTYLGRLPLAPGASLWDESPPAVFLADLDSTLSAGATAGATTFSNSARDFYGSGGVVSPANPHARWREGAVVEGETAIISSRLDLPPGANATLRLTFGYRQQMAPSLDTLLHDAARSFGSGRLAEVARAQWAPRLLKAHLSGAPWLGPELAWHSFYLQAAVSFDSHFGESVIDQGTACRRHGVRPCDSQTATNP